MVAQPPQLRQLLRIAIVAHVQQPDEVVCQNLLHAAVIRPNVEIDLVPQVLPLAAAPSCHSPCTILLAVVSNRLDELRSLLARVLALTATDNGHAVLAAKGAHPIAGGLDMAERSVRVAAPCRSLAEIAAPSLDVADAAAIAMLMEVGNIVRGHAATRRELLARIGRAWVVTVARGVAAVDAFMAEVRIGAPAARSRDCC